MASSRIGASHVQLPEAGTKFGSGVTMSPITRR